MESGLVALELTGTISMGLDCEQLQQEIEDLLHHQERRIILDLSSVQQIDSAAVGKIVACFSLVKKSGGELRVAGAQGPVEGVLKTTHVDKIIPLFGTAAAAAEGFADSGRPTGRP